MCDYDGDFQSLGDRQVARTRKAHECSSGLHPIPVGSPARYWSGLQDGDWCDGYVCATCQWAQRQEDHGPLHLCYGWGWGDGDGLHDGVRFDYLASALARGVEPTVLGVIAEIRCHLLAEAGDDPEARADAESWTWPAEGAYA